ncbi:pentapeptide repeat-containing protein [Neosynechococcus sphagnicola]|uniref:pentapeptide repeat-containing protein n=1 Tax=Neosynechococcus sphagnicola TaxID=1501145 RepID=UPI000689A17E|nr:pentapeptide repeat-containing protein [Neosynechococcus sphagnicola]
MANELHLAQLGNGSDHWNDWIYDNLKIQEKPDFSNADLQGIELSGANFIAADFSDSDLREAGLIDADLELANFHNADLSKALLVGASLGGASLVQARLCGSDLTGANLNGAQFVHADLRGAILHTTQALGTNFTGANLTGACIQDWNINSSTTLEGVVCDYVFLKHEEDWASGTEIFLERRPRDESRNFAPGEFVALFQKALETVDLIFIDGVDWKAFFQSFQELRAQYGEENLSVQAIEKKSGDAFIIRLEVSSSIDKAVLENQHDSLYKEKLAIIQERIAFQDEQLNFYRQQVQIERQNNTNLLGVIQTMAENQSPKYDMRGSNFGNFADTVQAGGKQQNVQHIYASESKQSLAEAAQEIQALLKQLESTNPQATEDQQMAYVNSAIPPTLKQRVVAALKEGGEAAIDEFLLENKYLKVGKAVIKGWVQTNG